VAAVVTVAVLVAISNAKQRYLREPLLFCDFALLEHVIRHPALFYVPRRQFPAVLAAVPALIAAIAVWLTVEPGAGVGLQAGALGLAIVAFGLAALWPRGLSCASH